MNTLEHRARMSEVDPLPKEGASGFIQWKGTSVCMDLTCRCGQGVHLCDKSFTYFWECLKCGEVYALSSYIRMVPLTEDHKAYVKANCELALVSVPEEDLS